jgi:FOG: EAL domain
MQLARQPIIDIETKKLYAFELLARNKPDLDEFVAPPPNHMFWSVIDKKVLVLAEQFKLNDWHLIVNVSEATLADDGLYQSWADTILKHKQKHKLSIEITEQVTSHTLHNRWLHLKELNVPLVMDDFGDENNTLSRLIKYPWDICKFAIDETNHFNTEKLDGIEYCKRTDIEMIAERIETKEQAFVAAKAGIKLQQGYLWGRPEILHEQLNNENNLFNFALSPV